MTDTPFSANERFYERASVVDHYSVIEELLPAESRVLSRWSARLAGADLLDLGVGAGRTVKALTALCGRYTGIDYSAAMIDRCRARHPGARLYRCHFQDMSLFADASFGAICGLFNPLADVGHEDRLAALGEIARVLARGGYFIFSAHNLDAADTPDDDGAGHAVVVEQMHGTDLPTYYITREAQAAQLAGAGFEVLEVSDGDGNPLTDPEKSRDRWLYYVAIRR
ncbi:MAG TPA: class I SAM-dependent methyltransferase [Thermoanaerobaculia bacterium]|jgi:SAM-dependent methyltransferase|nr:class I SAM-dependent methyltransferase [Thermoanaerobaculia bacterium]